MTEGNQKTVNNTRGESSLDTALFDYTSRLFDSDTQTEMDMVMFVESGGFVFISILTSCEREYERVLA